MNFFQKYSLLFQISILIILIINFSCVKLYQDPTLNINNKTTLIIEGCINNVPYFNMESYNYPNPSIYELYDSYIRIHEFNVAEYQSNNTDFNKKYITDAIVILKDDLGNIDTMKTPLDPTYKIFKNRYAFNFDYKLQKINPKEGHNYFLEVYYKGNKYVAQTSIPKNRPIIDSFFIEPNPIIQQNNDDPESDFSATQFDGSVSYFRTAFFFKDIANEDNYFIFKPFNYKIIDFKKNLNEKHIYSNYNDSFKTEFIINEKSFQYLDGWQTSVLSDAFLTYNKSNKVFPFLGTWVGKRYTNSVESKSNNTTLLGLVSDTFFYPSYNNNSIFERDYILSFFTNKPTLREIDENIYLYNNKYKNIFWNNKYWASGNPKLIFWGTIDKNTYIFFKKLKELYTNDGGSFSPSPFTPKSNIEGNNVFGYFYGVNAFVYPLLTEYPCVAYPNGVHLYDAESVSFYLKQYLPSLDKKFFEIDYIKTHYNLETPPFEPPFLNYK